MPVYQTTIWITDQMSIIRMVTTIWIVDTSFQVLEWFCPSNFQYSEPHVEIVFSIESLTCVGLDGWIKNGLRTVFNSVRDSTMPFEIWSKILHLIFGVALGVVWIEIKVTVVALRVCLSFRIGSISKKLHFSIWDHSTEIMRQIQSTIVMVV